MRRCLSIFRSGDMYRCRYNTNQGEKEINLNKRNIQGSEMFSARPKSPPPKVKTNVFKFVQTLGREFFIIPSFRTELKGLRQGETEKRSQTGVKDRVCQKKKKKIYALSLMIRR